MKTNIQSIGFTASEDLTTFVKEKAAKISLHFDNIITSEVCLKSEKSATNDNKICDIRLVIPGNDLLASAQCTTFEEAIALASDAIIKQIEKHKAKIHDKRVKIDIVE
jgi:putative sigma-54 modulation protein